MNKLVYISLFALLLPIWIGCQSSDTTETSTSVITESEPANSIDTASYVAVSKSGVVSESEPKKEEKMVEGKEKTPPPPPPPPAEATFSNDYLMGKFIPSKHPDFTTIKAEHSSRSGMYLRKDTYQAFQEMYKAALADGVRLTIISATRDFYAQKGIWEAKWEGRRKVNGQFLPANPKDPEQRARLILMYSSMPGTSRHHWGTDIDLNNLNNSYFESGKGKQIYDWLVANAATYGFCQVYSPKGDDRPYGYEEEKWHWSYLPVAKKLTNLYKSRMQDSDIEGFEGAETAQSIGMIEKYVLGINPACK